jgi:AraC family transcriptional regulator
MSVEGHGAEKYRKGELITSSIDRGWRHLLVERRRHPAGEIPSLKPRDTEISIQLNGRTVVERQGGGVRERTFGTSGTVWLCPAGIREEFINIQAEIPDCLHIYLPGKPFADSLLEDLDVDPANVNLLYKSVPQDSFISELSEKILRELLSETSSGRLLIESLSRALSAYLVCSFSGQASGKNTLAKFSAPLDAKRLSRVIDFIDANLDSELAIADLARAACLSASHLARGFKAATGRTIHGFVSGQRLEVAKKLLSEGEKSLAEIAYESGFSSQANFSRAFRRITNSTPGQYRDKFGRRAALGKVTFSSADASPA